MAEGAAMGDPLVEPLRIGVLGAARIARDALIDPARLLGHRVVAVAARDHGRATRFSLEHDVERVHPHYRALLDDGSVEAVYIALPNGWHGHWTKLALKAGKHVLCEKPSAANAQEAKSVHEAVQASGCVFMEAMHYVHHPMWSRIREIVGSGVLGEVTSVRMPMAMPSPPADDVRWSWSLAGGAMMDLGCYSLSALADLGTLLGGDPTMLSCTMVGSTADPRVDARAETVLHYPSGAVGRAGAAMDVEARDFGLTITGGRGSLVVPSFMLTHLDDRLFLTVDDRVVCERLGARSTYTYQLDVFAAAVRTGAPMTTNSAFSCALMHALDRAYALAGLPVRLPASEALTDWASGA